MMAVEIHSFTPAVPQEADDGNQHPVQYRQSQEKCVLLLQIWSSLNSVYLACPFVIHHLEKSHVAKNGNWEAKGH